MPRTSTRASLPPFTFLSWAISRSSASGAGLSPGIAAISVGRPTAARCRSTRAASPAGQSPRSTEKVKASRMPMAIASPCSEPVGIAGEGFERVTEGVAEIEQSARALLLRSSAATMAALARALVSTAWRRSAPGVRRRFPRPIRFEPGEERRIAEQPVFHHLGIAGTELARAERRQHGDVGEHQARLVEGADQVLALPGVDAGLAADRGVDLGQQRGRHLHDADAAPQDAGGEAGQVADHAAAEGDDAVAALDAELEQAARKATPARGSSCSPRPALTTTSPSRRPCSSRLALRLGR